MRRNRRITALFRAWRARGRKEKTMIGRNPREWSKPLPAKVWLVHNRTGEIRETSSEKYMEMSREERAGWLVTFEPDFAAKLRPTLPYRRN